MAIRFDEYERAFMIIINFQMGEEARGERARGRQGD
jgi:hypothetical protein